MRKSKILSNSKLRELKLINSYLQIDLSYDKIKASLNLSHPTLEQYLSETTKYCSINYEIIKPYFTNQKIIVFLLEYENYLKDFKSKIVKIMAYPSLLLMIVYLLMIFFLLFLIPTLLNLLTLLKIDAQFIHVLIFLLQIIFMLFSIGLLLVLVFVLIFQTRKGLKLLLMRLQPLKMMQLVKLTITYRFAMIFNLYYAYGFSTKDIFYLIRQNRNDYLVQWIATLIEYELDDGHEFVKSMNQSLLDSQFIDLVRLSSLNSKYQQYASMYKEHAWIRIEVLLSKISSILKISSYILLGSLVVLMYLILLAPISLLEKL